MSYQEDTRRFNTYSNITRYCESCGHSKAMPIYLDKTICEWCGNYVFRNEQIKFKFRLEQAKIKLNIGGRENENKCRQY